ncbi:hypothetical protein BsWGS_16904 [Bradybaena similaris]
MLDRGH